MFPILVKIFSNNLNKIYAGDTIKSKSFVWAKQQNSYIYFGAVYPLSLIGWLCFGQKTWWLLKRSLHSNRTQHKQLRYCVYIPVSAGVCLHLSHFKGQNKQRLTSPAGNKLYSAALKLKHNKSREWYVKKEKKKKRERQIIWILSLFKTNWQIHWKSWNEHNQCCGPELTSPGRGGVGFVQAVVLCTEEGHLGLIHWEITTGTRLAWLLAQELHAG